MDFLAAIKEASERAPLENSEFFVYRRTENNYIVTTVYKSMWLFRAYPGGRKMLSIMGTNLARTEGILKE